MHHRQAFASRTDLSTHVLEDHRITRMKCPGCLKYYKTTWQLMAHCSHQ